MGFRWHNNWMRWRSRHRHNGRSAVDCSKLYFRPQVERLEDRTLLSAGDLDPTFGVGGKVTTPFGTSDDQGQALVKQSDGRLVIAGYTRNGGNLDFAVARYTADGNLDPTFGTEGKVTTDF